MRIKVSVCLNDAKRLSNNNSCESCLASCRPRRQRGFIGESTPPLRRSALEVRPGDAVDNDASLCQRVLAAVATLGDALPEQPLGKFGRKLCADEGYFSIKQVAPLQECAVRTVIADPNAGRRNLPKASGERLPGYPPEINPIEYLWGYAKGNDLANFAPKNLRKLSRAARNAFARVRKVKRFLRAFWIQSDLNLEGL